MQKYMQSTIISSLITYDAGLLKKQITENSKKIDQYLKELNELEIKLTGNIKKDKAIA